MNLVVNILGIFAFSCNVQFHGGYLGQMCILIVDILGKCAIPTTKERRKVSGFSEFTKWR